MIWIDNRLPTSIGLRPSRISGHLTAAATTRARTGLAGSNAQLFGARQAADAAFIDVTAFAVPATLPDRAAVQAAVEQAYGGGVVRTLRTMDRPNLATRVLLDGAAEITELPQAPSLTIPRLIVRLRFLRVDGGSSEWPCPGPILLGTSKTPIPVGSLPSAGQLYASGYTSPLVITYTPGNGLNATTWTVTQSVASDEHIAADLETSDVYFVASGGGRTRVSTIAGTAPAMDPLDAVGSSQPTLKLSSGIGLFIAAKRYRA